MTFPLFLIELRDDTGSVAVIHDKKLINSSRDCLFRKPLEAHSTQGTHHLCLFLYLC